MDLKNNILPFFPLGVFLLPGEDIPLRVFEPRYKQLIADIRNTEGSFVIPFVNGREINEYGCEVGLEEVVAENLGGHMVISVKAISVVKILSFRKQLDDKLYSGGEVSRLPSSGLVESPELSKLIRDYRECFDHDFLNCCPHRQVTRQDVMKALNLPSEDKYQFMRMQETRRKEAYLSSQIRYLEMICQQEMLLDNDFGLN